MKRRDLLTVLPRAALALSGVATAAPAAVSTDARLIGLCAEFEALERKAAAAFAALAIDCTEADEDRANAVNYAVHDEQAPIVAAIIACRPATPAGFTALAGVAVLANPMLIDDASPDDDYSNRMVRVLLSGMTGRAAL